MEKPCDDSIIDRMPVEILALIFLFVQDAMTDFQLNSNAQTKAQFHQPPHSPPLLVGAVCRRWRDSTLETPKLWTDIVINLAKCAQGQFNMVEQWACRSGALPLDITIFDVVRKLHLERPPDFWYHFKDVIWVIRSLANRWHDLALCVPGCFSYHLLNKLQGIPPINSLFLQILPFPDDKWDQKPILQHPLLPRRFIYRTFLQSPSIPIEWDRLIYLEMTDIDPAQILHIIRHAQNLKHCSALGEVRNDMVPTGRVTNHSLIYLKTNQDILGHLILPSLLHFEFTISRDSNAYLEAHINDIVGFVHRSRAPLDEFIVRCTVFLWVEFPDFDGLPEITSLFLDIIGYGPPDPSRIDDFFLALTRPSHPILPRLKKIDVILPCLTPSSWSLIAALFSKNTGSIFAPIEPTPNTSTPLSSSRQLSQCHIRFNEDFEVLMDKETFLRLLEAKKSGFDLIIMDKEKDLFEHMAKLHDVSL